MGRGSRRNFPPPSTLSVADAIVSLVGDDLRRVSVDSGVVFVFISWLEARPNPRGWTGKATRYKFYGVSK